MALPDISLAQFNAISTGKYNAGQIDFKEGENGQTELVKVNDHVHKRSLNKTVLSPERILEVKQSFLNALRNSGVEPARMAEIRSRLGLPEEVGLLVGKDQRAGLLEARFSPLTRAQVRAIIDEYATGGENAAPSPAEISVSNAAKRDLVNRESLSLHVKKGGAGVDFAVTDAMSILSCSRPLADLDDARSRRSKGANAVNENAMKREELATGFKTLFSAALGLLPANERESAEFRLCGETVKLVKGDDGRLSALLGKEPIQTKVDLGMDADTFVARLIGRVAQDRALLGAIVVKGLLGKVYDRDINAGLVASERTSLTRQFASLLVACASGDGNEGRMIDFDAIVRGNYNTGLLVDIAEKAIAGEDVGTKAKLDAYHEKLVHDTANLPPEMKAMLEQVANVPIERLADDNAEFIVRNPIVANVNQVAPAPQRPAPPPPTALRDIGGASAVKDFVADLVFSDETMVADVVVNRPGETMRAMLSTDNRLLAFSEIVKDRNVLDTAVAPQIRDVVKDGFAKIVAILDEAWRASHDGETIAAAAQKDGFLAAFSAFVKSADQLPGEKIAQFDGVLQLMANNGCEKIQAFVNSVFNVDVAAANEAGSLVNEPYKGKSADQIKAGLKDKSLGEILDTASNSDAPGQVGFFRQVVSGYFTSLGNADKRSCFAAAMRYASDFDFGDKRDEALQSANAAAINKFTGAILKGTSPLLQKMMQGLPKDVMGEFSDALEDMKCNLAPIPRKVVQAHLMKLINDSNGKIHSIKLEKSLGAASVGEAFLCRVTYLNRKPVKRQATMEEMRRGVPLWTEVRDGDGNIVYQDTIDDKEVVIKIMRHDAERRMESEAEIFTAAAAKIPGMAKTWEGQLAQYRKEFDFTIEARNVNEGVEIYDIDGGKNPGLNAVGRGVSSMKLSPLVPTKKDVLVAEVATGDTVDRYFKKKIAEVRTTVSGVFEQDPATGRVKWQDGPVDEKTGRPVKVPVMKQNPPLSSLTNLQQEIAGKYSEIATAQKHLIAATRVWFHEALFGSGKFHGDTHAGNLMVAFKGITFIDFGNLYTLNGNRDDGVNEKNELLRIMTGAAFRDKSFVLKGFENLLSPSGKAALQANRAKAEAILETVLGKGKFAFDIVYRLNAAVSELQKLGIELPPQVNCFIQSMARLANTVSEMNTIMKQFKSILDAAGGYVRQGPAPARDELDLVGKAFDFYGTAEAKEEIENPQPFGAFAGDGATITRFRKYMYDNSPEEAYAVQVAQRLSNAADPAAEAENLVSMLRVHLDPAQSINDRAVTEDVNAALENLRRELAEAGDDAQKRAAAVGRFAQAYQQQVRRVFSNVSGNLHYVKITEITPPNTFASALVNLLLDNYDALSAAFDKMERGMIAVDAAGIAHKEFNVGFWKGQEAIMRVLKDDAQNTAADTDTSSYRIDIGV